MRTGRSLQLTEARAALDFAAAVADCVDESELTSHIATLPDLVGADSVIVLASSGWMSEMNLELGDSQTYGADLLAAIGRSWRDHPLLVPDLAAADRRSRRLSDFVAVSQWRRGHLFNDFYRPLGMAWELSVQLAWGPAGSSCCVAVHRSGRDFSDGQRALLDLIAPHLRSTRARIAAQARVASLCRRADHARARIEALCAAPSSYAPELSRRLAISAREAEVLACLAAGRTNGAIALELGISPHTVLRHVEHVYRKLDLHTRATATRLALETLIGHASP